MAHRGCPLVLRNRAPQPCETLSLPPPAVEQFSEIQRFSLEHARDNPRLKKELQELNALLSAANDIERRHETVRTADAQAKLRGPAAHWAIWQNTMEQLAEKLSSPQLDLDAAALEVRAQREQVQKLLDFQQRKGGLDRAEIAGRVELARLAELQREKIPSADRTSLERNLAAFEAMAKEAIAALPAIEDKQNQANWASYINKKLGRVAEILNQSGPLSDAEAKELNAICEQALNPGPAGKPTMHDLVSWQRSTGQINAVRISEDRFLVELPDKDFGQCPNTWTCGMRRTFSMTNRGCTANGRLYEIYLQPGYEATVSAQRRSDCKRIEIRIPPPGGLLSADFPRARLDAKPVLKQPEPSPPVVAAPPVSPPAPPAVSRPLDEPQPAPQPMPRTEAGPKPPSEPAPAEEPASPPPTVQPQVIHVKQRITVITDGQISPYGAVNSVKKHLAEISRLQDGKQIDEAIARLRQEITEQKGTLSEALRRSEEEEQRRERELQEFKGPETEKKKKERAFTLLRNRDALLQAEYDALIEIEKKIEQALTAEAGTK